MIKQTTKWVYLICDKCKKRKWITNEKFNENVFEFTLCNKCENNNEVKEDILQK